jgi:uncharacterized protein involved in exopolysaccharide biosynthesis
MMMAQEIQGNTSEPGAPETQGGSIDLGAILATVKAERLTFLTVLFICIALAVLYLHVARIRYAVRMEITSASTNDQAKEGGLSALSSIAGISLGGEGSPQFRLFLGSLRSPIAAEAIVSDQDLLKAVFYREWSQTEGRWREPPSVLRAPFKALGSALGWKFVTYAPPGVSRVYDYLNEQLKVIPDNKSGVVTLEIDSDRPATAERVLLTLNAAMNQRLQEHDLEHATIFIGYLTKRLVEVNVVEYRSALIQNIAQEEKTRMQASSPLPYASDILGKPMVSSRPVSPKPGAAWGVAVFFGALLGFWFASRKHRRK